MDYISINNFFCFLSLHKTSVSTDLNLVVDKWLLKENEYLTLLDGFSFELPFFFWETGSSLTFLCIFGYITFFLILLLTMGIIGLNKHIYYFQLYNIFYYSVLFFFGVLGYTIFYTDCVHFFFVDNLNIFDSAFFLTQKYIYAFFIVILFIIHYYTLYRYMNMLEYYILVLSLFLSTLCLISSIDFVSIFLSLEILSLTSYILVAYARTSIFALEGGVKYFILGSLASAFFLIGVSIFFSECASTNIYKISILLMNNTWTIKSLVIGFFFISLAFFIKLGIAPFHFWLPDAYEGASFNNMILLGGVPKLGLFVLFLRWLYLGDGFFLYLFQIFFFLFALLCIFVGAFGALRQTNIKRFLAYSSINNFGFILIAASINSALGLSFSFFYFFIYLITFTGISSFLILLTFNKVQTYIFEKMYGLYLINLPLAILTTVYFLSFAGIPPFVGFFAKFSILLSLIGQNFYFMSFALLMGSVFSSFYYIKIIKIIFAENVNYNLYFRQKYNFGSIINYNYFAFAGFLLIFLSFYPELLLIDSYSLGLAF